MSLVSEPTSSHPTSQSAWRAHPPLIRTQRPGPLLKGLLSEWEATNTSPRALRRANSWGLPGGPVDRLDDMVVRAGFGGPHDSDESDTYLFALVSLAAHDPLAARIVLHRILPPVLSIAQRRGRQHSGGIEGAIGDLVTRAWLVITCYPIERRPRKVASNLVRDIEYLEYVADNRPRRARVEFIDHGYFTTGDLVMAPDRDSIPTDSDDVRNLFIELERHEVSPLRKEILRLSCDGWQGTEIGRHLGINERTVRWHRAEALKTVSSFVDEVRNGTSRGVAKRHDDEV